MKRRKQKSLRAWEWMIQISIKVWKKAGRLRLERLSADYSEKGIQRTYRTPGAFFRRLRTSVKRKCDACMSIMHKFVLV